MTNSLLPFQPACTKDPGSWCATIYQWTDSNVLARWADAFAATAGHILFIVLLAVVARWAMRRLITRTVEGAARARSSARHGQRARTIGSVLRSISSTVVLSVAAIMVMAEFGVDLAPVLASAGIVGVAVGFGAQNLVRDFLSGIFMLLEDQYGVGDIVDVGPASGTVEAVGLRITTVRDINGTVWYVRNGEIQRVGNKSQGFAVAVVDLLLGHSAPVTEVTELAGRVARERLERDDLHGDALGDVDVLGLEEIANEGMRFRLTVRVKPGRQWAVQRALYTAITEALDAAGVMRPGQALLGQLMRGPDAPGPAAGGEG